jgi:hypothetical protein
MSFANPERYPRLTMTLPFALDALRAAGPDEPELALDSDVTLQIGSLVAPVVPEKVWFEEVMRAHLPPTAQLSTVAVEATTSDPSWPVTFAPYEIFDDAGPNLEERAGTSYRNVHNRAEVDRAASEWRSLCRSRGDAAAVVDVTPSAMAALR